MFVPMPLIVGIVCLAWIALVLFWAEKEAQRQAASDVSLRDPGWTHYRDQRREAWTLAGCLTGLLVILFGVVLGVLVFAESIATRNEFGRVFHQIVVAIAGFLLWSSLWMLPLFAAAVWTFQAFLYLHVEKRRCQIVTVRRARLYDAYVNLTPEERTAGVLTAWPTFDDFLADARTKVLLSVLQ